MKENRLPPVRTLPDAVGKGYGTIQTPWIKWPLTEKALIQTYYLTGFPHSDQEYCLAGLQQFEQAFRCEHEGPEDDQPHLDAAAAHEVRYHALRGRTWRRACAALATCWLNLVMERPERILDRRERAARLNVSTRTKGKATSREEENGVIPNSIDESNPFAEQARKALQARLKQAK